MKKEVLDCILKNIYKLTHTPVIVIKGKEIISKFTAPEHFDMKAYYEKVLDTDDEYNIICTPQSLAFGMIRCDDYKILLGPVKSVQINNTMLRQILLDNNFNLDDAGKLKKALDFLSTMQIEYFALLLAAYYVNINHKIITADMVLKKLKFEFNELNFDSELLRKQSQIVYGDKLPHNTYEYEQKMLYCVRNGLAEELHKLGHLTDDQNVDVVVSDTLRHYKNMVMAQKTLISRAAIDGGVDPETAYSLSDIFSHKIESCQTLNQISELSYSIRDTYCKMVRDVKHPKTNDLIVNQAIAYVYDNVAEKITVNEIAEKLNISREYLSSKFKKITGQPLPDFITEQKIALAKKLLRFSDKPLIEIANYLSFSSQAYFQTQFKKVTGMTPLEYRTSNS